MDYEETFSQVAKLVTVRALMAVDAILDWQTCQMDVSNIFMHVNLLEEVYMKLPIRYVGKREPIQHVSSSVGSKV